MNHQDLVRGLFSLATFLSASVIYAQQEVPEVISPLRIETDANSVNVVTGKILPPIPTIIVPAAPNLRFDWVQNAAPYMNGQQAGPAGEIAQVNYSVHTLTGTSESFRCPDFDCQSITGTGSAFVPNANGGVYWRGGSGEQYVFNQKSFKTTGASISMRYYASSVSFQHGEVITFAYDAENIPGSNPAVTAYRPNRVTSNLGYFITITYHTDDVLTGSAWSIPAQATLYKSSAPTTILDRLSYSSDGFTITDFGGREFQCSGCVNNVAASLERSSVTLTRPGESSATLDADPVPNSGVVGTVTRDGVTWNYGYTNLGFYSPTQTFRYSKLRVTGPEGYDTSYTIEDHEGRNVIDKVTDSIGRVTDVDHDTSLRLREIVYPEGNKVNVTYDNVGNITLRTTTAKDGASTTQEEAHYVTSACNGSTVVMSCFRPQWFEDALDRRTDFEYNAAGQLTEQTDPADEQGVRRRTIIEYQTSAGGLSRREVVRVCGDTTTCGTPDEIRTEYDYWENTFLPSVERRIDAAQGVTLTTNYTYDAMGRLLVEDGPLPGTADAKYFRYDEHGRREWEIGPAESTGLRFARKFEFRDSDDKVIRVREGSLSSPTDTSLTEFRRTDYAFDSRRNPSRDNLIAAGATQTVIQRTFDQRNRLQCEARRMNPSAFGSLPSSACTPGAEGDFGPDRITRNEYDDADQLIVVQRAYGTPLEQDYATYTYTPNGKRETVKDANNNLSTFEYDGFDRLQKLRFPVATKGANQSSNSDYEQYGYDAVGNRTSLRKRDGKVITSTYDDLNRLRVKTVPASTSGAPGYSVFYRYDVRGLLARARFGSDSGQGITNTYDGFGRLRTSSSNMGGTARTVTSDYDAHGNRTRITHPDGKTFEYAYDSADRLFHLSENGPSITLASIFYDAQGRREELARDTAGAITAYDYDDISRLDGLAHDLDGTGVGNDVSLGFAFNPASQITTRVVSNEAYEFPFTPAVKTYVANGRNQYSQVGGTTHTWDANGNLTDDGPTTFGYDTENRLVSASGAKNATLKYDPLGRLYEVSVPAGSTTRFVYDGDRLIAEYVGSALQRRYVHGAGVDEPLIWYEGAAVSSATRRYLHADHQGSIVAVSTATGATQQVRSYDAYGLTQAANTLRFQYTGQAAIPELGLLYYKARFYNPALGRFMQTDPIGYEDELNIYAYVGNDPLNGSDPTGMAECTGSRVGAGCDFVQGSLQRLQLLAGRTKELLHNMERAALGSEAASTIALGASKTKNAISWLAAKIGFKTIAHRTAGAAAVMDVTEIGGKLNAGDVRGAAEATLTLTERLAGAAAGAQVGSLLGGEVGAPIGAIVGTFAPDAMQSFNAATLDATERGINTASRAVDSASRQLNESSLRTLHEFVDQFRGPP